MELNVPRVFWTRLSWAIGVIAWVLAAGFSLPIFAVMSELLQQPFIHSVLKSSHTWASALLLMMTLGSIWRDYENFIVKNFNKRRVMLSVLFTAFAAWYFSTSLCLNSTVTPRVIEICSKY